MGLQEVFKVKGIPFHSYPKGDGSNESATQGPHGDYHFHMNGEKGKVVTVDKDGKLTPENPKAFSKKELGILNDLSESERKYLRKACREVFHNNAKILPKLKLRYLGGILGAGLSALQSNSYEETCSADYADQLGDVCE